MLVLGILMTVFASIVRGYFLLNFRRLPGDRPPLLWSEAGAAIPGIGSTIVGLIGSVMIGAATQYWWGILVFLGFWILSKLWGSLLETLGL